MKGLHIRIEYKEMFGKYEGMGSKILTNICLDKSTKNMNA